MGDVKYKTSHDWGRADLYQAISFAVGFGVKRCAIVSFGAQIQAYANPITVGDIEVTHFGWPVDIAPDIAEEQLTAEIKSWITAPGVAFATRNTIS